MFKNIKNVLLLIIMAAALASSVGLFMLKEAEEANRVRTEEQFWQEEVAKKKNDEQLSSLEADRDSIRDALTEKKREAASLASEMIRYKGQVKSAGQKIAEIDNKVISTERKIGQLTSNIAELKTRIANILNDTLGLEEEFSLLQKTSDALKKHLAQDLEKEQAKEVIGPSGPYLAESQVDIPEGTRTAVLKPSLVGEVLIVNREFDFIIVSLGRNEGIEEGMIFDICRDDNILGRAEVETVRANISAAALVGKKEISRIRTGDKALFYSKVNPQMAR